MGVFDKLNLPDNIPDSSQGNRRPSSDSLRLYAPAEALKRAMRSRTEAAEGIYGPAEMFKGRKDDEVLEIYGPAEMLGSIPGGDDSPEEEPPPVPDDDEDESTSPDVVLVPLESPRVVYGPASWFPKTPQPIDMTPTITVYGPAEPLVVYGPAEMPPTGTTTFSHSMTTNNPDDTTPDDGHEK